MRKLAKIREKLAKLKIFVKFSENGKVVKMWFCTVFHMFLAFLENFHMFPVFLDDFRVESRNMLVKTGMFIFDPVWSFGGPSQVGLFLHPKRTDKPGAQWNILTGSLMIYATENHKITNG